jgi:phi13 family phage major tail protein
MAKKVKIGFKNCYYATITEGTGGAITYGTPVQLNGAVALNLSPSGDTTEFYADDSLYWSDENNNGYEGTLELALVPDDFAIACLGATKDTNNVLVENAGNATSPFALLCEFTNDDGATKFAFYNCHATRQDVNGTTKGENKEVQTETLNITIRPRADGLVKVRTTDETTSATLSSWYTAVYVGTGSN